VIDLTLHHIWIRVPRDTGRCRLLAAEPADHLVEPIKRISQKGPQFVVARPNFNEGVQGILPAHG